MKEARDSNPWVPIVAGVLGVLAVGLAVRQCGSSAAPESVTGSQLAAAGRRADSERGGWIAQPQSRGAGDADDDRSAPGFGRHVADGRAGGAQERGSDFAPPRRGGARDDSERDFRDTNTVDVGDDAIPAQPGAPPLANAARAPGGGAPGGGGFGGATGSGAAGGAVADASGNPAARPAAAADQAAKPGSDKTNPASQTQPAADANAPVKVAAADENGPVLSLPLDKSVDADKSTDNAPIIANGVTFDANGAHFSNDAQLALPSDNVNQSAGSVTFWILPDWAGDTEHVYYILHLGSTNTFANRLDIFKDHVYLRLLMCLDTGIESGVGPNISAWKKGDRHMITGTWGDGVVALYIDGVSVGASDYDGELNIGSSPPLFLGAGNAPGKEGANSNITNFQMYTRALDPDEIASLYAQPPS